MGLKPDEPAYQRFSWLQPTLPTARTPCGSGPRGAWPKGADGLGPVTRTAAASVLARRQRLPAVPAKLKPIRQITRPTVGAGNERRPPKILRMLSLGIGPAQALIIGRALFDERALAFVRL